MLVAKTTMQVIILKVIYLPLKAASVLLQITVIPLKALAAAMAAVEAEAAVAVAVADGKSSLSADNWTSVESYITG